MLPLDFQQPRAEARLHQVAEHRDLPGLSHAEVAALPRWVGWRNESRAGRPTKVPRDARRGGNAKADDPATWADRARAEAWAREHVNGAGGGIGLQLGAVAEQPGVSLGGVDLDACRDPATGALQPWAMEVVGELRSYAEVSPSGTGVKVYFTYATEDLAALRAVMGTDHGRSFKRGSGDHPPAIELHIGNRYFAWTGQHLHGTPVELRPVPLKALLWLVRVAGPGFVAGGWPDDADDQGSARDGRDDGGALMARLRSAMEDDAGLAKRWSGGTAGLADASRSGLAFTLGAAIKRHGFTYPEMRDLLLRNPHTREWAGTKGGANGERELRRIWENACAQPARMPNMAVLSRSAAPAPAMPLDVLGPTWSSWVERAAEGSNAPSDYVVMPLLAAVSSLVGNARWVVAWRGWAEPPALWCASVGDPSSGKTSGAAPITRDALRTVERQMARGHPAEVARWDELASVGRAALKQWEQAVAKALKAGDPVPAKPELATIPPKPIRPRASVTDATVEAVAPLLAGLPKGVLNLRDEMAGWLLNLSRYANGGSDRPFWLEAYNGGPHQVDRAKFDAPILIPRLAIPAFGTVQPERLADILGDVDDGLSSRFLWAWPDTTRAFRQPADAGDPAQAAGALQRLADLSMPKAEGGDPVPSYVHLDDDARPVLVDFAQEAQRRERDAHGLLKSALGKARGQALRLALVLEFLWWCAAGDGPEPSRVSKRAVEAAAGLMDAYFLPMAARVLRDASVPEEARDARTLAAWIMAARPAAVNVSEIRDTARLPGLRDSDAVKAACRFLAEAGWLSSPEPSGRAGRPRGDWTVNPLLFEAVP